MENHPIQQNTPMGILLLKYFVCQTVYSLGLPSTFCEEEILVSLLPFSSFAGGVFDIFNQSLVTSRY